MLATLVISAAAFLCLNACQEPVPRESRAAIERWADEFQPSALERKDIVRELEWFARAARPFRGMRIRSVAEDIKTHRWEAEVLTRAFQEITGIEVVHEIRTRSEEHTSEL